MAIPTPRDFDGDLTGVPRHWFAGNAAATAVSNGINLLFPHGERFFVRSVHKFADSVADPALRAQIKGFYGQEGRHAHAHDELNQVLRAQGYEIDTLLERYARVHTWIEKRVPAKLNLASTAAAEHFTAMLADDAFRAGLLDAIDPRMAKLLAWHAAEEIEHKAVAFDVLRAVDPSYALRIAGLIYATTTLAFWWFSATSMLLKQDGLSWRQALAQLGKLQADGKRRSLATGLFSAGIRRYIKRGFHPNDHANYDLANAWFAERGLAMPEAA